MINLLSENPRLLTRFLEKFKGLFSEPLFESFSKYLSGLFLELKRTNIQAIQQKAAPSFSYENLQYFLSEGKWEPEIVNEQRIKILQSSRTTKTCNSGVLVIDDTSCKKWGIHTQGAKPQYSATEDKVVNCNVLVLSAYCDRKKRYPVNFRPYLPKEEFPLGDEDADFKSKLDLAQELVDDALKKELSFGDVVFDNWYFAKDFISFLNEKGLTWITEAEDNRLISWHGKWVRADELVKVLPSTKFNRRVTVPNSQKGKRSFLYAALEGRVKGLKGRLKIVVALGSWDERDTKGVHVFVTNHLSLSDEETIARYALRWGVECIFRDLKENVAFDQYQVRSIKAIERHWHLSCLAYTFLFWANQNGYFSKIFKAKQKLKTMGECLLTFRRLNTRVCIQWLQKNPEAFAGYLALPLGNFSPKLAMVKI